MTVPCSEKEREEKWVCPSFMIPTCEVYYRKQGEEP